MGHCWAVGGSRANGSSSFFPTQQRAPGARAPPRAALLATCCPGKLLGARGGGLENRRAWARLPGGGAGSPASAARRSPGSPVRLGAAAMSAPGRAPGPTAAFPARLSRACARRWLPPRPLSRPRPPGPPRGAARLAQLRRGPCAQRPPHAPPRPGHPPGVPTHSAAAREVGRAGGRCSVSSGRRSGPPPLDSLGSSPPPSALPPAPSSSSSSHYSSSSSRRPPSPVEPNPGSARPRATGDLDPGRGLAAGLARGRLLRPGPAAGRIPGQRRPRAARRSTATLRLGRSGVHWDPRGRPPRRAAWRMGAHGGALPPGPALPAAHRRRRAGLGERHSSQPGRAVRLHTSPW